MSRVAVVFYKKHAQGLRWMRWSAQPQISFRSFFLTRVERDLERRAKTPATAFCCNCAVMKIDKMFGNGQSQTQPAKLPSHRRISLFEWPKERNQALAFDPNPVIGDFEMEPAALVIKRADGDLSTGWRKFHGVVDQIPKHLLQPDAISPDVTFSGVELRREPQFLHRDG